MLHRIAQAHTSTSGVAYGPGYLDRLSDLPSGGRIGPPDAAVQAIPPWCQPRWNWFPLRFQMGKWRFLQERCGEAVVTLG